MKKRQKGPYWKTTSLSWKQRVGIWEQMAKGLSNSQIQRDLELSDKYWNNKTIGKVRDELASLPVELTSELSPEVKNYWQTLNPDTKAPEDRISPKQIAEMKKTNRHLRQMRNLRKTLQAQLWTPPPHYIPTRDLSFGQEVLPEHTVIWEYAGDGPPVLKLPAEGNSDFGYFKQHTQDSNLWDYLTEWKRLGGLYILYRAVLFSTICQDIESHTQMPMVSDDGTRGILAGFYEEIYRSLFPRMTQDYNEQERLIEEGIAAEQTNNWSQVAHTNKQILQMYPDDLETIKRLGKTFAEMQMIPSAKELYSRALEIDPDDVVAQKNLKKLNQDNTDATGLSGVDGGRYRVVSRKPDQWLVAVFTDDIGTNIAWACPSEVDRIIAVFQNLLRKYRSSQHVKEILKTRTAVDRLENVLVQDLNSITPETLAATKCDGCPA